MLCGYEESGNDNLALIKDFYLGPARVREVVGNRVQLEFHNELQWALLALAYPYRPSTGDVILAAGQNPNWYVIGVLQGAGKTKLMVFGDFELLAPRGRINLVAGKGVEIKSPKVKITTEKLELVGRTIIETFTEAMRWIKGKLQIHAGQVRTQVKDDYQVKAKRINEWAENDVKIDGNKIHLG